jgi:hypothetical protein
MTETIAGYLRPEVLEPLKCNPNVGHETVARVEKCMTDITRPLDFLSTKYRQDEYFARHPFFVPPESIPLGSRYEMQGGKNILVYDTFEYVSVEKKFEQSSTK